MFTVVKLWYGTPLTPCIKQKVRPTGMAMGGNHGGMLELQVFGWMVGVSWPPRTVKARIQGFSAEYCTVGEMINDIKIYMSSVMWTLVIDIKLRNLISMELGAFKGEENLIYWTKQQLIKKEG